MSLKKQFLKTKPECKITFTAEKEIAEGVSTMYLAGEFNGWSATECEMKKSKSGDFSVTINLPSGGAYQYKFVADGERWITDPLADRLYANEFGGENSVAEVVE
jgi:1,4-alpha-glucan branching enzyme